VSRPEPQRWYCPSCGDVILTTLRSIPLHTRWTTDGEYTRHHPYGEPLREVRCPGGDIDPEKDRAP
jgi:hypothetical protein